MNKFIFCRVSNLSFAFTFSTRYSTTRFTDQPISVNLFKIILSFRKGVTVFTGNFMSQLKPQKNSWGKASEDTNKYEYGVRGLERICTKVT